MSNYPVKFGKYLLLERVNVGGMAEVFKAKTFGVAGFERILAIKRILPNLVEDDEFIRMFIDEARIAVQLNHTNIVQIYELGKHGEHYYIAMEYVPSRDLRAILDRMRSNGQLMPIPQAAYVCKKVCEGLDYAHKKRDPSGNPMNIIHRDVSPQNILVGFEGEVKVIDFGIAKAANRASKTQAGVLKGKFGYMSPEQVRGLPTDRRSDIFAVGVLLYEMLTGERLFIGESDFSTLERVRNAEVVPPTNFNKKISQELEQIVLKTLAREVEDRFQWANELAEALEPFMVEDKQVFNMKRLAASLKEMYAPEIALEKQKLDEFLKVTADDAKPERGGPATSSILPLHHPSTDPAAAQQSLDEPEDDGGEAAAGFGADKTFVIEASTAGLQLQNQETDLPQKPIVTSQPSGRVSGPGGAVPRGTPAASSSGSLAAPRAPQAKIRPSGVGGAAAESSPSNTAPRRKRPENTNDDFLEQHSLYGDDSADADDSRTLVSAPNPFMDKGIKDRTGEDDDDEIDASEAQEELASQPWPSNARGQGIAQTTVESSEELLSDAPTQTASRGEIEAAAARMMAASQKNPPAKEVSATRTALPQPKAAAAQAAKQAIDPVAAAMEEEERLAMEVLKGTSGGRVDASRARAPGNDVAGGPQLPSPSWGSGNTPADDIDIAAADEPLPQAAIAAVPAKMMKMLIAALAGSFAMFLIVLVVGIIVLTGKESTLELYAYGDVPPPSDVKVQIDGVDVGGLDTPHAISDDKQHVVTITGTGIEPVTRTVRPTGSAMRQPVLFVAATGKTATGDDRDDRRDEQVVDGEASGDSEVALARPVPPPAAGGWRLTLAAVAETGKPVAGADVWVDGQLYGRTPLETELDPALDKVMVRVKKDGYVTREVSLGRDGRDRVGPATIRLAAAGLVEATAGGDNGDDKVEPKNGDKGDNNTTGDRGDKGNKADDKVAAVKASDTKPDTKAETRVSDTKPATKPDTDTKPNDSKPADKPPVEKKAKALSPIQIGTQPFADTVIDGRKYGSTPFYGPRKLDLSVGKHRVEFTDKTSGKKYRFEINILAPDPENKVIIVLGKGDPPRVTGKMQVKILP